MDSSSGMKRRGGWTWKTWLGIALGVAVLVAVILIAANAGAVRAASTDADESSLRVILVGMLAEMERKSASVRMAAVKGRHDGEGGPDHAALTLGSSCEYRISAIRLAMMTADEKSRNSACNRKKSFERIANTVSCPSPG